MAQTVISGLRDLTTGIGSTLIPPQVVQREIDLMTKEAAQWTYVTRANKKKYEAVGNWGYLITEDLLIKNRTTLLSGVAVGATSWVLAASTGPYVSGWDILWNTAKNVFVHVQSVATDTCTVVANIDSGTDVAGDAGDEVIIISNATQEAGGFVTAKSTTPTQRTRYVTDILTSYEFSDMGENADSYWDQSDFDFQMLKIGIHHQRKIELASLLGPKSALLTPSGTYAGPTRNGSYSAGLTESFRAFMAALADTDHNKSYGAIGLFDFMDLQEPAFYGENEPQNKKNVTLWVPPIFTAGMAQWFIGQQRFTDKTAGDKSGVAGLRFTQFAADSGPINMVKHIELKTASKYYGFFADTSRCGYVPYKNLDTHIRHDVAKGADDFKLNKGYIRTVFGTHYTQANAHVMFTFTGISR